VIKYFPKNYFCDEVSHNREFLEKYLGFSNLDIFKMSKKCPNSKTPNTFWKKYVELTKQNIYFKTELKENYL
jgi:hypothetical protein